MQKKMTVFQGLGKSKKRASQRPCLHVWVGIAEGKELISAPLATEGCTRMAWAASTAVGRMQCGNDG